VTLTDEGVEVAEKLLGGWGLKIKNLYDPRTSRRCTS
jgi:hypothetical protein